MKPFSPSFSACIIVAMSCLFWTGAISFGLAHFLALSATVSWIIAGLLGFLAIVAVTLILHGMRHATDLADFVDPEDFDCIELPARWNLPSNPGPAPRLPLHGFPAPDACC